MHPNGKIKIDDIEELNIAFKEKIITDKLFVLAMEIKEKLQETIIKDIPKLKTCCLKLLSEIKNNN